MKPAKITTADVVRLRELQEQMKWEEEHDNDSQMAPRYWVIRNKKPEHSDKLYETGETYYFYNDGDMTEFGTNKHLFNTKSNLINFLQDDEFYRLDKIKPSTKHLLHLIETDAPFNELWNYVKSTNRHFNDCFMTNRSYIVEDAVFLTKKEAKDYIQRNQKHLSAHAHTYAMTATQSLSIHSLIRFIQAFDFDVLLDNSSKNQASESEG